MKNFMYHNQITHHTHPCFNLFTLHDNLFDNQGSEINKNDIFLRFDTTLLYSFSLHMCTPWCSGYHYCTASSSTKPELRFCIGSKPARGMSEIRDARWWGSLTMALAKNKAKRLLSVNHTTKSIHHILNPKNSQVIYPWSLNFS